MAHPPLRDLLLAELVRLDVPNAELARRIAAARGKPATRRSVEATLARALTTPGRTIAEGLLLECLDALGVEVVLRPRRGA